MQASKQLEKEYWRLGRGVSELKKSSQVFLSYALHCYFCALSHNGLLTYLCV